MKGMAWHTDIVVAGQGMNLKVKPRKDGCYALSVMPDVPGRPSAPALKKFVRAYRDQLSFCRAADVKKRVERAVKETRARWNGWHREAY